MVKNIARISCYPNSRCRDFFTRAICLLFSCDSLHECKIILKAVFIISQSYYEGSFSKTNSTVRNSILFLQSAIAHDHDNFSKLSLNISEELQCSNSEDEYCNKSSIKMKTWLDDILIEIQEQSQTEGDIINTFYVPDLKKK